MIWRGFELAALVVGQLVSVRQVIRPTSSRVDSTTLQSCTCTQTRHNKPSHAHAPFPPLSAHPPMPSRPKNSPQTTEVGAGLKIHERLRQCNDPSHAAVNTARQAPAPASVHVDRDPTHASSLHSATPADRRGRRCRLCTVPCHCPSLSSYTVERACRCARNRSGADWIGTWRSFSRV
jgi:hypothetical protein